MVQLLPLISVAALSLFSSAGASNSCGGGTQCPTNLPCCSQYGECGVGAYCLGGCDPINSHSLDSCVPAPVCQTADYKLTSIDKIAPNTDYLGDASTSNWVSSGDPMKYTDSNGDQVLLTMKKGSVGTLLASTSYVWYGKISATMKTSRTQGVVTAFILLSDVKDEIDFEFIGTDLNDAQSNFYWQGVPDYNNEKNISVQDTFNTYHTYEIDWNPDSITWSIDGTAKRVVKRSDTWNATDNQYHFPQTPARVQLSLWPAGLASNGKGTVEWAGGLVDWTSPDVKNAGYFYAMVSDVNVQCYDPPTGASVKGSKSYTYNNKAGTNNTVVITDNDTILSSFQGSGLDPSAGASSASATATGAAASSEAPSVPGLSGVGTGQRGGNTDSSVSSAAAAPTGSTSGGSGSGGSGSGSSGGGSGGGSGSTPSVPLQSNYANIQGGGSTTGTSVASQPKTEKVLQGSMLAVLVAIFGLLAL